MTKEKTNKLTDKQKRFCEEYIIDLNATQAAIRAGYSFIEKPCDDSFYIYFLVNPISEKVFYIGKGKNKRAYSHTREAKNGIITNAKKHTEISSILQNGLEPIVLFFTKMESESFAYCVEKELIEKLKGTHLTNISLGTSTNKTLVLEKAKSLLESLLPFDVWLTRLDNQKLKSIESMNETPLQCYNRIVFGLEEIVHKYAYCEA